jgi:hypothetical protein
LPCIVPDFTSKLPLLCLALAACSDPAGGSDDGGSPSGDAAPLSCSEMKPLTIGQCIDADTDAPCLNFESTARTWISIENQPVVPSIIGLQGSPMFVMSVSGEGIEPGRDSDSPYVQLEVDRGDMDVGAYAARPTVIDDPNAPGFILAPQLYVVALLLDEEMVGQTVQIKAQVRDLNEDEWCTEGSFEIGALVEGPPLP